MQRMGAREMEGPGWWAQADVGEDAPGKKGKAS